MKYHSLLSVYGLEGKSKNRLVLLGILAALEIAIAFSYVGDIMIPPVSITTLHILVIIAAMLLGPLEGGVLGLVFGLTSMWKAEVIAREYADLIFAPGKSGHPLESVLLALVPRILLGVVAGLLFMLLFRRGTEKRRGFWVGVIAIVSAVFHMVLVEMMAKIFFPESGMGMANSLQEAFSLNYVLIGILTIVAVVLSYYFYSGKRFRRIYGEHIRFVPEKNEKYNGLRSIFGIVFILLFFLLFLYMGDCFRRVAEVEYISVSREATEKYVQLVIQFLCALISIMLILEWAVLWIQEHYEIVNRKNKELEYEVEIERQANQAKTDFLSAMSHDIRTPMNAIMGMTAIASMHTDDPKRMKDCLDKIAASSQHLLGLINEVLDMSKIETGKIALSEEEFNLSQLMEDLLAIFHPQIKLKQQELEADIIQLSHEEVVGDSMRLQQVFVNIMGNAVKFTPEGGKISLKIQEVESARPGVGCYEFAFKDSGIGMDPEFVRHIFEPFSRASDSCTSKIEGTGLGMTIAQRIVQMMDGEIQVESTPGKGSLFKVKVYLKLCESDGKQEQELKGLRVLVVDDDLPTCETVCGMLKDVGMCAEYALDGDKAIARLKKLHQENRAYHIIIMDWKMPGKDGIETTREIRKTIDPDTPIIILSAYDWSVIEQEARNAGANGFVAKPLFKSRLVYAMKQSLLSEQKAEPQEKEAVLKKYENKRILLVEDNELNIEIAQELLSMTGVDVEKAYDGKQAVDAVLERGEGYYDLIFMDIQMPNMNGYDAATAIRNSGREDLVRIPIVAMTANAFAEDVQRAKGVGMNDHIAKPVEPEKLYRCLETFLSV